MTAFRSILAVYNGATGSEAVLEQAVAIAHAQRARLTLLKQLGAGEAADEAHMRLRRIVPWVVQQGVVKVETAVTADPSYPEIIRQVEQEGHDLVVISANDGPRLRSVLFGDLGTGLMRNCPCPVWVVRPEQTVPCTRILAAVGGDDGDPRCEAMNGCIVGLGAALARSHDAELHIVHAWSPRGKDAELLTNEIADETREHVLRRNEAACRSAINRLLSETPVAGLDHQIHLPRGLPQREIVSLAGRLAVDVVVMGGTWRTGIPRLLMGNPAETVFGTIGCSVLTLKAEGIEALQPGKPDVDLPSAPLRAVGAR